MHIHTFHLPLLKTPNNGEPRLNRTDTLSRFVPSGANVLPVPSAPLMSTQWALWVCQPAKRGMPFKKAWVIEKDLFPNRDAPFYREFGMALVALLFRLHAQKRKAALKEASSVYRRLEPKLEIQKNIRPLVAQILI